MHRYTMGDVPEDALFVGLGVGQAWALAEHLEIGWELTGRRVSAYEKDRYVRMFDVTRRTTHEAEYLGALAITVGGVF
ncbi:MAG: hypothetical protein U5R14_06010 [Gemmatimonadota bacterium]|nr:hypothetical protein [Gemmatimonadota bacterium]